MVGVVINGVAERVWRRMVDEVQDEVQDEA